MIFAFNKVAVRTTNMWKLIVSISLFFSVVSSRNTQQFSLGIVGGDDADIADYPYSLSLMWKGNHVCGAVLIASNWALTSAACVHYLSALDLTIRAGSSTLSGGQVVNVKQITESPLFDADTKDYDLSVLELEEDVIHPNAGIVDLLPSGSIAPNGAVATATGWGYTVEGGSASDVLQKIDVPVLTQEICQLPYGDAITDRMVCAGFMIGGGQNICTQDFGGPLVLGGRLIGVASWTKEDECSLGGVPGVYTAIGHPVVNNFIRRTIGA